MTIYKFPCGGWCDYNPYIGGGGDACGDVNCKYCREPLEYIKQQDQWVDIKDRYPIEDGSYLVCVNHNPVYIGVSLFRNGLFFEDNVTHWMDLPIPPVKR